MKVLANWLVTPDGTKLQSFHRHDYKTHIDALTGEEYMIDGGLDYLRSNQNKVPATYHTVTSKDPHGLIREHFHWGTRGKGGKQPLTWKPLCDLDKDHIEAILDTQHHISDELRKVFQTELIVRNVGLV
jgi:hypothetical protein